MDKTNTPVWLNKDKLADAASDEVTARSQITVNLPDNFKTISAYKCDTCRLPFTSGQIEPQLKKAARTGQSYIECPKCSGFLVESSRTIVRDTQRIVSRAERFIDKNTPIQRGINTWIDKAIYGKLAQALANYVETLGISVPQLRFQRGIRSAKFPGEPHSAKGAEWTVEFTDFNNTRNRIVIQAGLDPQGKFIYPRTFKTLSGNEYPLTARAIENFTSGKVYTPVVADYTIPPLNFRSPDPTRFREISADSQKITKTGYVDQTGMQIPAGSTPFMDEQSIDAQLAQMGFDPLVNSDAFNIMKVEMMKKINAPIAATDNMGAVPNSADPGNFMTGVGLGKRTLQDIMVGGPVTSDIKNIALKEAIDQGLDFGGAFEFVMDKTGLPLELTEYDIVGQQVTNEVPMVVSDIASRLLKQAELQSVAQLHITADDVQTEYTLDDMTSTEAQNWMSSYVDTYNSSLDEGTGIVEAKQCALTIAKNMLATSRIKKALRDKSTLFPFTDPDPDYSLAQQTRDSEPKFDMPYDETDGGITPLEERNISTMFKKEVKSPNTEATALPMIKQAIAVPEDGKWKVKSESGKILGTHDSKEDATKQLQAIEINKHADSIEGVKLAESTGMDLEPEERGQNPINYSRYKTIIQDYLRAGNIPPTKVDLHKLKDGGYTLDELKELADAVKVNDSSAIYPTVHASVLNDVHPVDIDVLRKIAEDKIADLQKDMPLTVPDMPSAPEHAPIARPDGGDDPVPSIDKGDKDEDGEILEGGIGDNISNDAFDPVELAKGIEVEMEHIKEDRGVAEEIAKDHLTEIPDYYTRLEKMESDAKKEASVKDMPSLLERLHTEAKKQVTKE